jgi:hypothetical protein
MYEFADEAALDRAMKGDDFKRLIADFNRDGPWCRACATSSCWRRRMKPNSHRSVFYQRHELARHF